MARRYSDNEFAIMVRESIESDRDNQVYQIIYTESFCQYEWRGMYDHALIWC